MERTKLLKNCIYLLIVTCIIVTISYSFIDKQVTFWINAHHLRTFRIFYYFTKIPEFFIAITPVIYVVVILRYSFYKMGALDTKSLVLANSIAITSFLKDFLKFVFGRYWPVTWSNNPSLLKNNLYGFHFFHRGAEYQSFPSGHAAIIFASLTVLWMIFPKLRWIYIILGILTVTGILGMNYHFVSDIVAGGVLGIIIAIYTVKLS